MKRAKYVLLVLVIIILIAIGLGIKTLIPNKKINDYQIDSKKNSDLNTPSQDDFNKTEHNKLNNNIIKDVQEFRWNELGIAPIQTIEGTHYTFTAFDIINDSIFAFAGDYNKNIIRFLNLNNKQVFDSIELNYTPRDIFYFDNILFVLIDDKIISIKDGAILKYYDLGGKKIQWFDKFLVINSNLSLLMSDGSSYCLEDDTFKRKEKLSTGSKEIWILKTSKSSFTIYDNNNTSLFNYKSSTEIGTIAIAGGFEDIYCCIDIIYSNSSYEIERIISSSKSEFKIELLKLPKKNYSFIKNDYKIHDNIIYYLEINSDELLIKRKQFE